MPSLLDYGGVADGVTDNTQAFANAKLAGANRLFLPHGTYKINGATGIDISGMEVFGEGDATVLDCTACTAGYPVSASGALTAIPALGANASLGDWTLTFSSAPSLNPGDVICIYNPTASSFSGFRTYYNQGEFCEVQTVSGTTVTLRSPLYDNYVAADVNAYVMSSPGVHLHDLQVLGGTGSTGLIRFDNIVAPILENLRVIGANDSAVSIAQCFGAAVLNARVRNLGSGTSANPYGLIIGNSQHVRVMGGDFYGRWEGTDFGGASGVGCVPNRDCIVRDAVISHDVTTHPDIDSAFMHGNSESCGYIDCTIYGGVGLAGASPFVRGGTVYARADGVVVDAQEVLGGNYDIQGVRMFSGADPSSDDRGIVDFGGNSSEITSSTTRDLNISVQGCTINSTASSTSTSMVKIYNRGTSNNINVQIDHLSVDAPTTIYILYMKVVSGTAASNFIVVDHIAGAATGSILATLNDYVNFPLRMQRQLGRYTATTIAAASLVTSSITFNYTYPRVPVMSCVISGVNGASQGKLDGQVAVSWIYSASASSTELEVYSASGSNFGGGVSFDFNWSASLDEC